MRVRGEIISKFIRSKFITHFKVYLAIRELLGQSTLCVHVSALSSAVSIHKSHLTQIIKDLEQLKFIKTINDKNDKRKKIIYNLRPIINDESDKTIYDINPRDYDNKTNKEIRAMLYGMLLESLDGRPITRQRLHKLTSITKNTQKLYEKLQNIKSKRNFLQIKQLTLDTELTKEQRHLQYKEMPDGYLYKQLGNSYFVVRSNMTKPNLKVLRRLGLSLISSGKDFNSLILNAPKILNALAKEDRAIV